MSDTKQIIETFWSWTLGVKKVVDGQLVATSIDVYLCMEFGDGGDVSPEPLPVSCFCNSG